MIEKEILDYYSLDGLRIIRDTWRDMYDTLKSDPKYAEEFAVANHSDCYIDREFDAGWYAFTITTDEETNETWLSEYGTIYYGEDGCDEFNINQLESFIESMTARFKVGDCVKVPSQTDLMLKVIDVDRWDNGEVFYHAISDDKSFETWARADYVKSLEG